MLMASLEETLVETLIESLIESLIRSLAQPHRLAQHQLRILLQLFATARIDQQGGDRRFSPRLQSVANSCHRTHQ